MDLFDIFNLFLKQVSSVIVPTLARIGLSWPRIGLILVHCRNVVCSNMDYLNIQSTKISNKLSSQHPTRIGVMLMCNRIISH